MKNVILILILAAVNCNIFAFSEHAHLNGYKIAGIKDLIGTPIEKGGLGNMSLKKVISINRWIDNPVKHIGEYRNLKAGGKLIHPLNHGNLRHNPFNIAKVFSGNGKIDVAVLNEGRFHKIQDIFNNKAVVDGWKPTVKMKKKAEAILRYAGRYKRLPIKRLPEWVDNSGPLMTSVKESGKLKSAGILSAGGKISSKAKNAGSMIKYGKTTKTIGKYALPAAIVIEGSILAYEICDVEKQFNSGQIDLYERNIQHGQNIGSCAGSMTALGVGVLILAVTPAGPVMLVAVGGVIVGAYVFDYTGKIVGRYIAEKYNNYLMVNEEYYIGLYKNLFNSIETCDLSEKELRECGFTDCEIKAYYSRN